MRATTLLAVVMAALVGSFAATFPASDPDLFWHLASGAWMLDRREILTRDVFSYTMTGTPYSVGEWLGQVVYATVFRLGGWTAIDLLRGLLVGVATFFISRVTLRLQPHAGWAAGPILGALVVSTLMWRDRPQLFSLALFPIFLDMALAARFEGRTRWLWALVPLAWLWAQLHLAFVVGVALVGIVALESWISRAGARRPLALAFVAMLILAQLTPAGPAAFSRLASYATSTAEVVEERAAQLTSIPGAIVFALLLVALSAALLARQPDLRAALRSAPLWSLIIPPFAVVGMLHQRNLLYAAVVLAPAVAALAPVALGRPAYTAPVLPRRWGGVLVGGAIAGAIVVAATWAPAAPDLRAYPVDAVRILRDRPGNLFHEYDWGGYLIFAAPEHPTYVDGRYTALFPASLIEEFQDTVALRPRYRDVLAARDIRLVLVRPDRALAVALEGDGWRVLGRADRWVLLERP